MSIREISTRILGARLLNASLTASVLLVLSGKSIMQAYLPWCEWVMNLVSQDWISIKLFLTENKQGMMLVEAVAQTSGFAISKGEYTSVPPIRVVVAQYLLHHLLPLVIFLMLLLAYPVPSAKQRVFILLVGMPASWVLQSLIMPLGLLGMLGHQLDLILVSAAHMRPSSWWIEWFVLLEGGARWILPILFSIVSVSIANGIASLFTPGSSATSFNAKT